MNSYNLLGFFLYKPDLVMDFCVSTSLSVRRYKVINKNIKRNCGVSVLLINNTQPILCHNSWVFWIRDPHQTTLYLLAWFSWNRFLLMRCPKFSFFLKFKDGADLRIESFSSKQSLHTFSPISNGFTFFDDLPFDVEVDGFFKFPNMMAKCC